MVDLSPCHICRRKPSLRKELDSFRGCEACGERTCFVCIRECEGAERDGGGDREEWEDMEAWEDRVDGHRRVVCSRCCVERGGEGEVRCFGCLKDG